MKAKMIYFLRPIGMEGPIKIGCSGEPARRLKTLDIWSPFPLELIASVPGDHQCERNVHWRFRGSRLHGEWFSCSLELKMFIQQVAQTGALPHLGKAPYGRTGRGRGNNPNRNPEWWRAKIALTTAVGRAEKHAYGYGRNRPQWVRDAVASYQGPFTPPASAETEAALRGYVADLFSRPKADRSYAAWKMWSDSSRAAQVADGASA